MAIRRVLTWPHPGLRVVAQPVERVDDDVRALVADMFETMYDEGGVGLAATQIDVHRRVIVIDCGPRDPDAPEPRPYALINPEIVGRDGLVVWREGCLSLPGITAEVERSAEIVVRFLDPEGEPRELHATGLTAVCIQHEMDHLEGQVYLDRLGALERKAVLVEYAALTPAEQAQVLV